MSFVQYEAEIRSKKSVLTQLHGLIDWEDLSHILGKLGRSGFGPTGYEPIKLLKALLLGGWHSLSDVQLEEALRDRMSFIHFTGFDGQVPDATTLCRFRNLLVEKKKIKQIFKAIQRNFESKGITVKPADKAIVDATIIASAARPTTIMGFEDAIKLPDELEDEDAQVNDCEDDTIEANEEKIDPKPSRVCADPDARWLKKGKELHFGYRLHAICDSDGLVHDFHLTPANVSEVTQLESVMGDIRPRRLYADKGYASRSNHNMLSEKGIKSGILKKAARNRPLTKLERIFNRIASKTRTVVERVFAITKRILRYRRASYMGIRKVEYECGMKLIAHNGLKAVRKISREINLNLGRSCA